MPGFPECFAAYGADHRDTMARFLGSESLYLRFLDMLPQDDNLRKLGAALADGDLERAFLAAHTLKGVSRDLGFTPLFEAAAALSDALRLDDAGVPARVEAVPELMPAVRAAYALVVDSIAII